MRDLRIWLAVAGLVVGGALILPQLRSGDPSAPVTEDELESVVFVCRDSGEAFQGKVRPTPVKHPTTGRATLMLGMYCPKCQAWHAVPSLEQLQRTQQAIVCPKTKTTLVRTGPLPEATPRI